MSSSGIKHHSLYSNRIGLLKSADYSSSQDYTNDFTGPRTFLRNSQMELLKRETIRVEEMSFQFVSLKSRRLKDLARQS